MVQAGLTTVGEHGLPSQTNTRLSKSAAGIAVLYGLARGHLPSTELDHPQELRDNLHRPFIIDVELNRRELSVQRFEQDPHVPPLTIG